MTLIELTVILAKILKANSCDVVIICNEIIWVFYFTTNIGHNGPEHQGDVL